MCRKRLEMDRLQELVRLHRMGEGAREVARLLGMSPNTEREYRQVLLERGCSRGRWTDCRSSPCCTRRWSDGTRRG